MAKKTIAEIKRLFAEDPDKLTPRELEFLRKEARAAKAGEADPDAVEKEKARLAKLDAERSST